MNAALRKIEAQLRTLADDAEASEKVNKIPTGWHELRVLANQTGAQAEMIEQGLVD